MAFIVIYYSLWACRVEAAEEIYVVEYKIRWRSLSYITLFGLAVWKLQRRYMLLNILMNLAMQRSLNFELTHCPLAKPASLLFLIWDC